MTRSKNKWRDYYARRAQKEKYAARSVFKLAEIQQKHRVIKKGDHVLDLGCSPGSWLQFAAEETGRQGRVIGVDLKPVTIQTSPNVLAYVGDIFELRQTTPQIFDGGFQVVLSDMAPSTTGDKSGDATRSFELCRAALETAQAVLKPGGRFVCKIFQGEDFKTFCDSVEANFSRMDLFKPQSSRKASREIFIIGLGKK